MKKNSCPVCLSKSISDLYSISVPVLQNRVFEKTEMARASLKGDVSLSFCHECNFVFNSKFDNTIIVYDTNYDNSVPSDFFTNYYHQIAENLYTNYNLKEGVLYDVGCGKGTFLKILCEKYPDVKAIGIDPSYEGELQVSPNLSFIQDFFKAEYVLDKPNLVISRHVFEHIENPVDFLKIISTALSNFSNIPFFIEVPDLMWIIKNNTYWDICYEHCNYFNQNSFSKMMVLSGAKISNISYGFNKQYLWGKAVLNATVNINIPQQIVDGNLKELAGFVQNIGLLKLNSQNVIKSYKEKGYKIVVWGMATKGVEFCNIVDGENKLIDYCIDINQNKQNKFIPFTGHQIMHQSVIVKEKSPLLVIIMNTNYATEIITAVTENNPVVCFIDGHGNEVI